MARSVDKVPNGFHTVTPYLIVRDGKRAIEFYKQAFGATEMLCHHIWYVSTRIADLSAQEIVERSNAAR